MPLFECSVCHTVDNTAIGNFWDQLRRGKAYLCAACDPLINQWHGHFDRLNVEQYRERYPEGKIDYPWRRDDKSAG